MTLPAQSPPPAPQVTTAQPHQQPVVRDVFTPSVSGKKSNPRIFLESLRKSRNIVSKQPSISIVQPQSITTPQTQPEQEKLDLDLFEQVLDEMDQEKITTTTQPVLSAQPPPSTSPLTKPNIDLPPLDQSPVSISRKEAEVGLQTSVEQAAGIQVVEAEKSPELSPEVEKYLQEVHDDKDQAPKEIAIADEIANLPTQNQFVSEPVIVVPITPEIERRGKRKSPKFSIRWLVEWSQKIIKMFAGKVVYMEAPSNE